MRPVGFELATDGIRFYAVQHSFRAHAHALLAGEIAVGEMSGSGGPPGELAGLAADLTSDIWLI